MQRRRSNASPSALSIGPCFVEDSRCSHLDNFFFPAQLARLACLPILHPLFLLFYSRFSLGFFYFRFRYDGKVLTKGVDIFVGGRIF